MRNSLSLLLFFLVITSVNAETTLVFSGARSPVLDLSVEVLKKAYKKIGIPIEIDRQPGKRSLYSSNAGNTDGEVIRIKGIEKQYTNLMMVPVPINHVDWMVLTKNAKFTVDGPQSLKPYVVGIRRGIKFSEELTKGLNPLVVERETQLLAILDRGRVDVIVIPLLSGLSLIKNMKNQEYKILKPPLATINLYHFLHQKHAKLMKKITESLYNMEKSGEIQKIRDQYISKQYESYTPL